MSETSTTPLLQASAMQDLRAGIAGAGVVSPHAFIRGLDAGYDREVMLDQWLRPLNEADDLRFRFQHGDSGWFEPGIGGSFYNTPNIKHAMASGEKPLFAIWCLAPAGAV